MMVGNQAEGQRNRAAVRIRAVESPPSCLAPPSCPAPRPCPGLTVPAWGCPHCHTSHTRDSADTHGRSGSHHSYDTSALSARYRVTGDGGGGVRAQPPPLVSTQPSMSQATRIAPVIPASAATMWVPGQVGSEQEAGVSRLAPGTLAGVGQAVVTGQAPEGEERSRGHARAAQYIPPPWAHWDSLAAERGTFLRALQGTPTSAPPAARCVPFAVGALMPLTEGVLGGWKSKRQLGPLPWLRSALLS